ncbi:hypothetical protein GCM10008934_15680 [Virgibacillus salarius]
MNITKEKIRKTEQNSLSPYHYMLRFTLPLVAIMESLRLPTSLSVGFGLQLTFLAKPAQKSGSSGQTFPTEVEVAGLRYYQALQR